MRSVWFNNILIDRCDFFIQFFKRESLDLQSFILVIRIRVIFIKLIKLDEHIPIILIFLAELTFLVPLFTATFSIGQTSNLSILSFDVFLYRFLRCFQNGWLTWVLVKQKFWNSVLERLIFLLQIIRETDIPFCLLLHFHHLQLLIDTILELTIHVINHAVILAFDLIFLEFLLVGGTFLKFSPSYSALWTTA